MHDAIEFILYEILIHKNCDIYRDGQHTIGLDEALAVCRRLGIDVPLLGAVRAIQKNRGDAKHHAQYPNEERFRKLRAEFRVIISRLVCEHFGESLGAELTKVGLTPYHQALYDSYRKYRNHNWDLALRFSLRAFIYKHREMLNLPNEYATAACDNPMELVGAVETDIRKAKYPEAKKETIDFIRESPASLRALLGSGNQRDAAELAGKAYLRIDEVIPSIFDIAAARKLTPRLVQPRGYLLCSSLCKWQHTDTADKKEYSRKLAEFLKSHPQVVRRFGQPFYEDDGDRYWKWWEFAVFDGERWSPFHLDDYYESSLETDESPLEESAAMAQRREVLARVIYEEFSSYAAKVVTAAVEQGRA